MKVGTSGYEARILNCHSHIFVNSDNHGNNIVAQKLISPSPPVINVEEWKFQLAVCQNQH